MRLWLRDIYNKMNTGNRFGTADYYESALAHDFLYIVQIEKISDCTNTDCLYLLNDMLEADSSLPVKGAHLLILNSLADKKGDFEAFAEQNQADVLVLYSNPSADSEKKSIILHYIAMSQELNSFSEKCSRFYMKINPSIRLWMKPVKFLEITFKFLMQDLICWLPDPRQKGLTRRPAELLKIDTFQNLILKISEKLNLTIVCSENTAASQNARTFWQS